MRVDIHHEDVEALKIIAARRINRRKQKPPVAKLIREILDRDKEVRQVKRELQENHRANQEDN